MTKIELEKLLWQIQALFNEHAGCLEEGCHCGGNATLFYDDMHKLLYNSIKPEMEDLKND